MSTNSTYKLATYGILYIALHCPKCILNFCTYVIYGGYPSNKIQYYPL